VLAHAHAHIHTHTHTRSMALRLDEENHVLLSNRCAAYMGMGQYHAALEDATFVCELAPQWPKGHSRLAAALSALGNFAESVQAYKTCLQLDPGNEQVREALAEAGRMAAARTSGAPPSRTGGRERSVPERDTNKYTPTDKVKPKEGCAGVGECLVQAEVGKRWVQAARRGDADALANLLQGQGGGKDALLEYAGQGTAYAFFGHSAMHWCAARGHVTCLELLIGAGADINVRNRGGSTPLHAAAQRDAVESLRVLLASGADVHACDSQGLTPQQVANVVGSKKVAAYMADFSRNDDHDHVVNHASQSDSSSSVSTEHAGMDKTVVVEPEVISAQHTPSAQTCDNLTSTARDAGTGAQTETETEAEALRAEGNKKFSQHEYAHAVEGNKKFSQHEYAHAVELYTQALSLDAGNHVVLSNRSAALLALKETQRALDDAKACVHTAPDWAKGHMRMGAAYLSQGELYNAVVAYRSCALCLLTLHTSNAQINAAICIRPSEEATSQVLVLAPFSRVITVLCLRNILFLAAAAVVFASHCCLLLFL
jgi:tetratricopeptide (TPR) repeat protein